MCDLDQKAKPIVKDWYFNGDLERFKPYLEEFKVFGGEPFACANSKKIVFDDPYKQINYSFITNGTLLTDGLLKQLESIRIGWIDVSLDSSHQDTYERIRKGSNFDRVNANLEKLRTLKDNHPIRKFPVYVDFVIQENNFEEIEDFLLYSNKLGFIPNYGLVNASYELLGHFPQVRKSIEKGMSRAQSINDGHAHKVLKLILASLGDYEKRIKKEKIFIRVKRSPAARYLKPLYQKVKPLLQ